MNQKLNKLLFITTALLLAGCGESSQDSEPPVENPPAEQNKPLVVVEICNNGVDDDNNGFIDCLDPACAEESHCIIKPDEICDNGIDDDGDGHTDCKDAACVNDPVCAPVIKVREICGNGIDDDENGYTDCEDPECFDQEACKPVYEICDNEIDDNGDGKIDCEDPECTNTSACLIDDGSPVNEEHDGVWVLPLTYAPYTTLNRAFRPSIGNKNYSSEDVWNLITSRSLKVTSFRSFDIYGLGAVEVEGEPWVEYKDLNQLASSKPSANAKSLAWFWQISDPQLVDEESPCRMEGVTIYPYSVASAYRPQDHLSIHMMELHIRTGKRISDLSSRPFDFLLVTGDIADNAQYNEEKWFFDMVGGGLTNPDSGDDDDPIEGPNNDFADPFWSYGIGDIPWYPAIGNHDSLYMGFSSPDNAKDDEIRKACVDDHIHNLFQYVSDGFGFIAGHEAREEWQNGFRDASKPDAPVVGDMSVTTPADPNRRMVPKPEMLQLYHDAPGMPVGHGLDNPDLIKQGLGYYSTYPMGDKPIRLITLDTNSSEWSEVAMDLAQFNWLEDELKDAKDKNELVLVQSHHGTSGMSGSVTQDKFRELLASYPNVAIHITGHGHSNAVSLYKAKNYSVTQNGYWEVMLASIIDFPSQTRLFELVWEGDTTLSIYITNLDANAPKGSLVYEATQYAAARRYFGTNRYLSDDPEKQWDDEKHARNMILHTRIPKEVAENLAKHEWSSTIESIETLQSFKYNSKL